MAKHKVIEDAAPSRPAPALTPGVLAATTHRLAVLEERVRAQESNIRQQLRETAPDLAQQIERAKTFLAQSSPGYELRQLVGQAEHVFLALIGFTDALDQARTLREEGQALLMRTKQQLATVQIDDMIGIAHQEQMEKAAAPLRFVILNLGMLLDSVAPLLPVARACVARTIEAAGQVGMASMLESRSQRLRQVELMAKNIRLALPEEARLHGLVERAAKTLDVRLTCPRLIWPSGPDPFAPPTLQGLGG